ncbi:hypothetical protein D2T31_05795 [Sinirhodobacter populi]|uniref:Uncharacterized protein n=1 Tax=Paenirhodobacter populi TaxID=2306993 RepID=A0A443KEH0_9RHOB|nr:hypothetical protein [Sinirhodobacter populi]RWR31204.1 hypothetical protein D2T31_05795 [Sinirhodobacter populi]
MTDDRETLAGLLAAPGHVWSVGTPAAVMAFTPAGPVRRAGRDLIAEAGPARLRIAADAPLLAFETISSTPQGWTQGIAICAPPAPKTKPQPIRRLTSDPHAIRAEDREAPVFDMGQGDGMVRVLFRPDPDSLPAIQALCGRHWAEVALNALSGTWITDTGIARIERWQPPGPVPVLILGAMGPSRATPLRPGETPVAHVFPPHPMQAEDGAARHRAFQALLAAHGRADLWRLKQRVLALLREGRFEDIAADRHGTATIRVALRQHLFLTGAPPPQDWMARYDRPLLRACAGIAQTRITKN